MLVRENSGLLSNQLQVTLILDRPVLIVIRSINFFAKVSTNPQYDINNINCYRQATDEQLLPLCDYEVEEFLRHAKRTSADCDDL